MKWEKKLKKSATDEEMPFILLKLDRGRWTKKKKKMVEEEG